MKVISEKGQDISLVLKAAPFSPQMNQAAGRIDNVLNIISGTYKGPDPADPEGAFLFGAGSTDGHGIEWHVDHESVLMFGVETGVDLARARSQAQ